MGVFLRVAVGSGCSQKKVNGSKGQKVPGRLSGEIFFKGEFRLIQKFEGLYSGQNEPGAD